MDRSFEEIPLIFCRFDHKLPNRFRFHHHGERLVRPSEKSFQAFCRFFNTADMKSPNPSDGNNISRIQQLCSGGYRIGRLHKLSGSFQERKFRSAFCAGDRLGMMSSVSRVFVIVQTCFAYRKFIHACSFPVVGNGSYYAVSWSAVGT